MGVFLQLDTKPYGRIFAFIDFGNVRPWAKDIWPEENKFRFSIEIDIEKLSDLCDWVKSKNKLFYYGFYPLNQNFPVEDPQNGKHRNSIFRIDKAKRCGFNVETKEIKMVPHYDEGGHFKGKFPKCNFDVEITMSMIVEVENYDTILLFSGDSDFGGLLKYLKSMGKKIIVVCTRSRMSTELQEAANKFIPAETLGLFLKYERKQTSALAGGGE